MSKPTAIPVSLDRAQSVMAFAAVPKDTDTHSDSDEDHGHIRSRSLDILRRSKRRSRSVDMMMAEAEPHTTPRSSWHQRVITAAADRPTSFTRSSVTRELLARSPSTPTTARPRPGQRAGDPVYPAADNVVDFDQGPIPESDLAPPSSSPGTGAAPVATPKYWHERREGNDSAKLGSPEISLSPASAIALAWTESQKRAAAAAANQQSIGLVVVGDGLENGREEEPTSSSTIPRSAFAARDSDYDENDTPMSPILFANTDRLRRRRGASDQWSPLIVQSPQGDDIQSPQQGEDYIEEDIRGVSSNIAEKRVRDPSWSPLPLPSASAIVDPRSESSPVSRLSAGRGGTAGAADKTQHLGVAATMREVSRRFTGALVGLGKEKKRLAHSSNPTSIPLFVPNSEPVTSLPPSSFSLKPVPKASLSHDSQALSFSRTSTSPSQGTTSRRQLFKNKSISDDLSARVHDHHHHHQQQQELQAPRLDSFAYPTTTTTEFGQFRRTHTPLHFSISTSSITSVGRREQSEVAAATTPPIKPTLDTTTTTMPLSHPPTSAMPGWLLPISGSNQAPSDHEDAHAQELTLSRQTSTGSHWTGVPSPLSPANSERERYGRIPPPRSNTPNTLKKRSKPSLRKKPSLSSAAAAAAVASPPDVAVPTFAGSHHQRREAMATTPPHTQLTTSASAIVEERDATSSVVNSGGGPAGGGGGKLRGLVKKLSSGALRRSSSQSDKSNNNSPSHSRERTPGVGGSAATGAGASGGGASAKFVPPVPQIPKDFELILDAEAYFAERARDKLDISDAESIPSTNAGHRTTTTSATLKVPGSSSQVSSRRSSLLGRREQPTQLAVDIPPSSFSSQKSRLRVDTEVLDRGISGAKNTSGSVLPQRRTPQQQPSAQGGAVSFPRRPNMAGDHSGSSNSQSTGTDHFGSGYRSSSPSLSSADAHLYRLYAAAASANFEERASSLSSHSHEMTSSYAQSLLAQPIMHPKDLYQRGEDEAAILRRQQQQQREPSNSRPPPRKRSLNTINAPPTTQKVQSEEPSPKTPPPILSPLLLPLTAPPPRPPRRVSRVKSSTVEDSTPRPSRHSHQRSLSSPISPTIPDFMTTKATNAIPLSKRSQSFHESQRSPQVVTTEPPSPKPSTVTDIPRARSISLGKKPKHLPQLILHPKGTESTKRTSPRSASGEHTTSSGERGSQPKMSLRTSLGTITRVKSMMTPKSASHTPSSSASYTLSPQSSGRRSSSSRASHDQHHNGHGWLTIDGDDAPPVPFTSTAFAFKESSNSPNGAASSPESGKPALTEGEREDLWNALLSRSDRVGGTLTIKEGPALLSDHLSFRED